ncbi:hypothetical protein [Riemerella columbipharyngis]|uniref:Uncharacterized protein n=1 Tax=Riemerella columbipharyngis TaxID=1071918 RepID=A0A1G7CYS9_9FLAO|nr:hypothetical protein [Riemerella columbipharyngis]SDE44421.1 hypothetical protein SAMN05421544_10970 [Riemerella columbipharyngis]
MRTLLLFSASLISCAFFSQKIEYSVSSVNQNKPISDAKVCFSKDKDTLCLTSNEEEKDIHHIISQRYLHSKHNQKRIFAPYQETINVDNTSKAFHL